MILSHKEIEKSLRRSQKILTSSFSDPIRMGGDCLAVRRLTSLPANISA